MQIIAWKWIAVGGVASGFLFRKYLSDLDEYIDIHFGVCVGDMIVAHILWADDLALMAESISGMQDQINKLSAYCSKNFLSVNETKTKCMAIGHSGNLNLKFNGKKSKKWKTINIFALCTLIYRRRSLYSFLLEIFFNLWVESMKIYFVKHTLTCVAKPRELLLVFGKGCETFPQCLQQLCSNYMRCLLNLY